MVRYKVDMNTKRNKDLKKEYQLNHRPAGIYQILNVVNDKVYIGKSPNLTGSINRHKFQLKMGNHPNWSLQSDWNEMGEDKFIFEVLDEITPKNSPESDTQTDLDFLEELWLEKIQPYGERGYNEPKKSRDEKLRMISNRNRANRTD